METLTQTWNELPGFVQYCVYMWALSSLIYLVANYDRKVAPFFRPFKNLLIRALTTGGSYTWR